jgi:hypothetical protein
MDWRRREFRHCDNPVLKPLEDILKGALGIVNPEGPGRGRGAERGKKLVLINAPETLSQLYDVDVRVARIASNHSLDAGAEGPQQTVQALG